MTNYETTPFNLTIDDAKGDISVSFSHLYVYPINVAKSLFMKSPNYSLSNPKINFPLVAY